MQRNNINEEEKNDKEIQYTDSNERGYDESQPKTKNSYTTVHFQQINKCTYITQNEYYGYTMSNNRKI